MGKRRRARELALQSLYQWDFLGSEDGEPSQIFWESQRDPEEIKTFALEIVNGVKAKKEEIDQIIETYSKHWKLYRMTRIDRNILRISVYELISCPDIPPKVSIDEAIEIAKKFGTSESSGFINGILDQIGKRLGVFNSRKSQGPSHEPSSDRDPG